MLTFEEIQQGVSENPELKTQLLAHLEPDATEYLKGKGFDLLTADQKSQLLKQHEDGIISPRIKEIASNIEKDIFEATGIKKEHDEEKYYAYAKRAIGTLKAQISDLQKSGVTDEATKQRIASMEAELQTTKAALESKDGEISKERLNWKVTGDFATAFSDLKIAVPAGVPEKDAANFAANKRDMLQIALLNNYTPSEQDGKTIYTGKDGKVAMNGGNFATAKDLLTNLYAYEFEQAQAKGGSGTGNSQQRGTELTGITDKAGIYAQVSKEGIVKGSAAFFTRVQEISDKLKIAV